MKKILLAMIPLMLVVSTAKAEDDLFGSVAKLDVADITDASIAIEEATNNLDLDALANEAGEEKMTEAIEACFHGYWGCYRPYFYSYCYSFRPVFYTYYYPIYSYYWGCY